MNALPPFLAQLRTTLGTLNTTLGIARPTLATLRPVAPLLTPTLREVVTLSGPATRLLRAAPTLLADAGAALPAITRFTTAFHPAIDAIVPAAREVVPIINFMSGYRRELVAAMSNLAGDLEATASANTPRGSAHYLRAISSLGRESIFGQTVREPTSRTNPYFSPGELANIGRGGLYAASCANTGNPSQAAAGLRQRALPRAAEVPLGQRDRRLVLSAPDPRPETLSAEENVCVSDQPDITRRRFVAGTVASGAALAVPAGAEAAKRRAKAKRARPSPATTRRTPTS